MSSQNPQESGQWDYRGGAAGTVNVPAGGQVLGITCHSTAGGSVQVNGGDTVPVPANVGLDIAPRGNLVAPTIVFTSTDSYFVEFVR